MNQNFKDIVAGFISGWVQVLTMQPFEIVKVRLQTQSTKNPRYSSIVHCIKTIAKEESLTAFYKGTVAPLIAIGFQSSAMFAAYQSSKRILHRYKDNPQDRLPLKFIAIAGIAASIPTAIIAAPVQHSRIRIQIQSSNSIYSGSVNAAMSITKNHGLVKGLYRGFVPTLGRQSIGQAIYFVIYEATLRATIKPHQRPSEAPLIASLLGGALAGGCFCLVSYPMDYMKTLMQTDNLQNHQYKNLRDVFIKRMKVGGIKTFYKGIQVTLYRALFVNAAVLFAFQTTMRTLGRSEGFQ